MSALPASPAAERNKQPILEQLQRLLPDTARVLEIGSGWGQHGAYFTSEMPGWTWQPSEQPAELEMVSRRVARARVPGFLPPVALDVMAGAWPAGDFEAVYSANTAHIMPWEGVAAMLGGVSRCLASGGLLVLYGPFNVDGRFTSPSNEAFDRELRARDPAMGIRDMGVLESTARKHHLILSERITMPANNFMLVFARLGTTRHRGWAR
jgi:cyclopropane fatty-acyl-phospholipid synthase-like methyltransferase